MAGWLAEGRNGGRRPQLSQHYFCDHLHASSQSGGYYLRNTLAVRRSTHKRDRDGSGRERREWQTERRMGGQATTQIAGIRSSDHSKLSPLMLHGCFAPGEDPLLDSTLHYWRDRATRLRENGLVSRFHGADPAQQLPCRAEQGPANDSGRDWRWAAVTLMSHKRHSYCLRAVKPVGWVRVWEEQSDAFPLPAVQCRGLTAGNLGKISIRLAFTALFLNNSS